MFALNEYIVLNTSAVWNVFILHLSAPWSTSPKERWGKGMERGVRDSRRFLGILWMAWSRGICCRVWIKDVNESFWLSFALCAHYVKHSTLAQTHTYSRTHLLTHTHTHTHLTCIYIHMFTFRHCYVSFTHISHPPTATHTHNSPCSIISTVPWNHFSI